MLEGVRKFAEAGLAPGGARRNLDFCKKDVVFPERFPLEDQLILSDPQTSGGMLIALPAKGLRKFERFAGKEKMLYWVVGEVTRGKGKIIIK